MYWNPQDYIERKTYRSLKKAWIGFKIAKKDGDQLRLPVSDFSDILKGDTRNDIGGQTNKQKENNGAPSNEL